MANATVNNKNKKKIKIGQGLNKTKFIKVNYNEILQIRNKCLVFT